MAFVRSLSLLLVLGMAFSLTSAGSAYAQDESAMTGRDYFNELKEAAGCQSGPPMSVSREFSKRRLGNPLTPAAAVNLSVWETMGSSVRFQLYTRGIGGNVLVTAREFRDDSTSRFAGRVVMEGEPNHFQFGINWNTGRFSLTETRGTTSGVCHAFE